MAKPTVWGKANHVQKKNEVFANVARIEAICDAIKASLKAELFSSASRAAQELWEETHKMQETLHPLAYPPRLDGTEVAAKEHQ